MAGQRSNYGKRSHSNSDYSGSGGNKRRNSGGDKDSFSIGPDDTVYRYLCPGKKIGSIIGRGGEIVKQLRADTKSKIRICDSVPGSEERVVTIYSPSEETNDFEGSDDHICPAQDALFRVHDRIAVEDNSVDEDEVQQVTLRLLVPSDQIGCIIGKGGQIIQNIRSETGAQIRIVKDDHLPTCALSSDELVQILGDAPVVRKALYQIAARLHDNPSRSQHLISSSVPTGYSSGSSILGSTGAPIMGFTQLVGAYGGYKGESADWSRSIYSAPRSEAVAREFALRLVCPTAYIGGVIGKGGSIINQIRQDSGASIKVDSSVIEGADDCVISISAKEIFEETISPAIDAVLRLQPRCSEKVERDSGLVSFTTRLLVPSSRIGCLIGKGGSIISEMRKATQAVIRVLSKENLPKVASKDEEMVQISGELDIAKDALIQVTSRLRANLFEKEGAAVSTFLPVLPYLPMSAEGPERMEYESRDAKSHGRGYSSYSRYGGSADSPPKESYGGYGFQRPSSSSAYGAYGSYSSGRSGGSALSGRNPSSRGRTYDY